MHFIDANIFLRYLTQDDRVKAEACYALFQRAKSREVTLTTTEAVIAEVVFVLSSRVTYALSRLEVRARLYPMLSLPALKIRHKRDYLRALDLYATHNVDFVDAIIVAQMEREHIATLYSYDRDFDRLAGVQRVEP